MITPPDSVLVLLVEDNDTNRELLRIRLEGRGYGVVCAGDGIEALEILEGESGRDFDIVLLDYMMPRMNGIDVLKQLRKTRSMVELPIIMQTALSGSEDVVECFRAGANDYVTKPVDAAVLFARMETSLRLRRLAREKDQFLAIASHDLKTPLATVRGFTSMVQEMLIDQSATTEEIIGLLKRVVRQTVTMEHIITDFLDFNALEEGKLRINPQPFDLAALLRDACNSALGNAEAKSITVRLAPDMPQVQVVADADRIRQVLTNLVGNGIKFSKSGSIVELHLAVEGNWAVVRVRDNGPGIPVEDLGRLFEKHAKLRNRPTGGEKSSGLGLAISKWLIGLHNGRITAFNNTGGEGPDGTQAGATFEFRLPLTP